VRIQWNNILPGNVSVFTQNKHNKDAPVPCTQITHQYITFAPYPSHYYVEQQWLFKQPPSIAENILDTIWNLMYDIYTIYNRTIVTTYLIPIYKHGLLQCKIFNDLTSRGQQLGGNNFNTHKDTLRNFLNMFNVFTHNLDTIKSQDIRNRTIFIKVYIDCTNHKEST
jgi:hypothetical protein